MKLTNIEGRKKNTFNNRGSIGWKLEFIFLDHLIVTRTHFLWDGIKCKFFLKRYKKNDPAFKDSKYKVLIHTVGPNNWTYIICNRNIIFINSNPLIWNQKYI
jgi:hypothetical protein